MWTAGFEPAKALSYTALNRARLTTPTRPLDVFSEVWEYLKAFSKKTSLQKSKSFNICTG